MPETVRHGRSASPGVAIGPLVRLGGPADAGDAPAGTPAEERGRLAAAVGRAKADLEALTGAGAEDEAAILAFQLELLDDPALLAPAHAAIASGTSATEAVAAALGDEIAGYAAAEDDYFRARAADLRDLEERLLGALAGGTVGTEPPPGAIVATSDLPPSRFLALHRAGRLAGAALEAGSPASHVAMLARARGVPLVTGLGPGLEDAAEAVVDADRGILVLGPSRETRARYHERAAADRDQAARAAALLHAPARTRDGEPVEVMLNVDDPAAVPDELLRAADGVGLWRTEFLLIGSDVLPGEDAQHAAYVGLLRRLGPGKPCVVRTLDVGADKPLPGFSLPAETNPFLGLRGVRLCLERPDLFRPQARALLRAAALGPSLKVMLPMVSVAAELEEARALFGGCLAELEAEGVPAAMPPLGVMVETPAAALTPDLLRADFLSIGSNDLTQYVMAAARDAGGRVGALNDPRHPALRRLIAGLVRHGRETGVPVSLCGDMASDPGGLGVLLELGLRRVSVAAAALGRVKLAIAGFGAARG
jgi:phosphoenolpyruvate-protein phosphotransferase (PTS system enzyme I)